MTNQKTSVPLRKVKDFSDLPVTDYPYYGDRIFGLPYDQQLISRVQKAETYESVRPVSKFIDSLGVITFGAVGLILLLHVFTNTPVTSETWWDAFMLGVLFFPLFVTSCIIKMVDNSKIRLSKNLAGFSERMVEANFTSFADWVSDQYELTYSGDIESFNKILTNVGTSFDGYSHVFQVTSDQKAILSNSGFENKNWFEIIFVEFSTSPSHTDKKNTFFEGESLLLWDQIHNTLNRVSKVELSVFEQKIVEQLNQELTDVYKKAENLYLLTENRDNIVVTEVLKNISKRADVVLNELVKVYERKIIVPVESEMV